MTMSKITITTQILDGNLGDGWSDNYEAAEGLADFTKSIWLNDLKEFADAGHEITIDIDVQRNTSGCSRDMSVTVEDLDFEAAYDLEQQVTNSMTSENRIWEQFCSSEEAEQYYETDG
jgi:hypothetical protein